MHGHLKERRGQNIHRSLIGVVRPSEYFITTVNRNEWGAHMSWANIHDGEKLREVVTGRFGSTLVVSKCTLVHSIDASDAHTQSAARQSLLTYC